MDTAVPFYQFTSLCRDSYGNASIVVTAPPGVGCLVMLIPFDQAKRHLLIDSQRIAGGASFTFPGLADQLDYRVECRSLDGNNNTASDKVTATTAGTAHTISFASGGGSGGSSSDSLMSSMSMQT